MHNNHWKILIRSKTEDPGPTGIQIVVFVLDGCYGNQRSVTSSALGDVLSNGRIVYVRHTQVVTTAQNLL